MQHYSVSLVIVSLKKLMLLISETAWQNNIPLKIHSATQREYLTYIANPQSILCDNNTSLSISSA